MKNKIISLSLVAALFTQSIFVSSLSAGVLGDSRSTFMNVTPGGSYSGGGANTFTTTSVYFRFGPSMQRVEPIFQVSAPSIGASCSGFNLKGMFIRILGLDRIAKMLKSAGASFAWGIVIGLIYSLPGVASAFNMINAWAKKIMEMIQAACQGGQVLGKAWAESTNMNEAFGKTNDAIEKFAKTMSPEQVLDNTENGVMKDIITAKQMVMSKLGADNLDGEDPQVPTKEELAYYASLTILQKALNAQSGIFIGSLLKHLDKANSISNNNVFNVFQKINFNQDIKDNLNANNNSISYESSFIVYDEPNSGDEITLDELILSMGISSDNKFAALMDLMSSIILTSSNKYINSEDMNSAIKDYNDKKDIILNVNSNMNLNKTIVEELSANASGQKDEKFNLSLAGEIIGKLFSYYYLGIPSQVNTYTLIDKLDVEFQTNVASKILAPNIGIVTLPHSEKADGFGLVIPFNMENQNKQFFPVGMVANLLIDGPISIFERYRQVADLIVGDTVTGGLTLEGALDNVGLPEVINFPHQYLTILKQSPIDAQIRLKDEFAKAAACQYIKGFRDSFPANANIGGMTGTVFKYNTTAISKYEGIAQGGFKIEMTNASELGQGMVKGFDHVMESYINDYGECPIGGISQELHNKFMEQDKRNRETAEIKKLSASVK